MVKDADRQERKAKTHGVLYVHGAGMPPDDKDLVGNPLSTIANGLIDSFNSDPLLYERYELATKVKPPKADGNEHNLAELDLDIFCKLDDGTRGELEYTIRMRDVLWKPTMCKRSHLDYVPLLWLWAYAFQSHAARIEELEARDRQQSDWDKNGLEPIETKEAAKHRRLHDFRARAGLAGFGLAATWLFAFLADKVSALGDKSMTYTPPEWLSSSGLATLLPLFRLGEPITTGVIGTSLVASVMLLVLGTREFYDRSKDTPHGRPHLLAMILATAWLSLFSIPLLLISYYFRIVLMLGIVLLAVFGFLVSFSIGPAQAKALMDSLRIDPIWLPLAANILTAAVFVARLILQLLAPFVVLTVISETRARQWDRMVRWLKAKTESRPIGQLWQSLESLLLGSLTTLLVAAGAPLVIALIALLDLLSVLPFLGDSLKSLAKDISEAGLWESLKDIHMFLTDSSRAAVARCCVEKALFDLAQDETVDCVHVLSHSLGTVVAYETLTQIGRGDGVWLQKSLPTFSKVKTFVTFGSPLNKVRTLAALAAKDKQMMADFDYTRFSDDVRLDGIPGLRWLNFYSVHDVASDVLSLYSQEKDSVRPQEFSVPSANDLLTAHGAYWMDKGFWDTILQAMGVIYPAGDLTRIAKLVGSNGDRHLLESLRHQGILTRGQLNSRVPSDLRAKLTGGIP